MSNGQDTAHVQFKITDQEHGFEYMPNGTQRGVWTISFETPSGVKSQVRIPDAHYRPETVRAAVAHQVFLIEQVHQLDGGIPPSEPPAVGHA